MAQLHVGRTLETLRPPSIATKDSLDSSEVIARPASVPMAAGTVASSNPPGTSGLRRPVSSAQRDGSGDGPENGRSVGLPAVGASTHPQMSTPLIQPKPTASAAAITELFDPLEDEEVENEPLHTLPCDEGLVGFQHSRSDSGGDMNPPLPPPRSLIHTFSTLGSRLRSGEPLDDTHDAIDEIVSVASPFSPKTSINLVQAASDATSAASFFLNALGQLFDSHERVLNSIPLSEPLAGRMGDDVEVEAMGSPQPGVPKWSLFGGAPVPTPYKFFKKLRGSEVHPTSHAVATEGSGYASDSDANSRVYRGASAQPNSVICFGYLKKAKDLNIGLWHTKYVEIRPGVLVYASDPVDINNPKRSSCITFTPKTAVFRPVTTWFGGKEFIFEVANSEVRGSKRFWKASSSDARQMWLDALEQSVLGPSSEVFQHHIWRCKSLMDRVRQADTVAEYSTAIKAATKEAFHVPYAWVAEQVARKQASSYRIAFAQVLKDYEREKVRINGIDYTESGGAQHVVFVLSNIIQTLSRSPSRQLTELEAFSVTRDILLHCNRTCFGGDSYDFASMLLAKDGMSVVCPFAAEEEALQFTISTSFDSAVQALDQAIGKTPSFEKSPVTKTTSGADASPAEGRLRPPSRGPPGHRRHTSGSGLSSALEAAIQSDNDDDTDSLATPSFMRGFRDLPTDRVVLDDSPVSVDGDGLPPLSRRAPPSKLSNGIAAASRALGDRSPPDLGVRSPQDKQNVYVNFEACSTYRLMDIAMDDVGGSNTSDDRSFLIMTIRTHRTFLCSGSHCTPYGDPSMTLTCSVPDGSRLSERPPAAGHAHHTSEDVRRTDSEWMAAVNSMRSPPSGHAMPQSTPARMPLTLSTFSDGSALIDAPLVTPSTTMSPLSYSADEFASNGSGFSLLSASPVNADLSATLRDRTRNPLSQPPVTATVTTFPPHPNRTKLPVAPLPLVSTEEDELDEVSDVTLSPMATPSPNTGSSKSLKRRSMRRAKLLSTLQPARVHVNPLALSGNSTPSVPSPVGSGVPSPVSMSRAPVPAMDALELSVPRVDAVPPPCVPAPPPSSQSTADLRAEVSPSAASCDSTVAVLPSAVAVPTVLPQSASQPRSTVVVGASHNRSRSSLPSTMQVSPPSPRRKNVGTPASRSSAVNPRVAAVAGTSKGKTQPHVPISTGTNQGSPTTSVASTSTSLSGSLTPASAVAPSSKVSTTGRPRSGDGRIVAKSPHVTGPPMVGRPLFAVPHLDRPSDGAVKSRHARNRSSGSISSNSVEG